jgi:hypothetical protein
MDRLWVKFLEKMNQGRFQMSRRSSAAVLVLLEELTSVGFQVVKALDDWPNHSYCVVFRRPNP